MLSETSKPRCKMIFPLVENWKTRILAGTRPAPLIDAINLLTVTDTSRPSTERAEDTRTRVIASVKQC